MSRKIVYMSENKTLGAVGEKSAADFLLKNNYKIIEKNYKAKFGEIDIIAKDKEYIVFVEVKTRNNVKYGRPCESVTKRKQNVIGKVASLYLAIKKLQNQNCRFDIIEVLVDENNKMNITHIIDAFQPKV